MFAKRIRLLKQKILFLLYFSQRYGRLGNTLKEEDYLSYNFLYCCLPTFKTASIRKAVLALVEEGELDKINRNHQSYFRLTLNAFKRIKNLFPGFFYQNKQKHGWFLAVLKEKLKANKEVRELRENLKNLGFTRLNRGVYLLPAERDFQHQLEGFLNQIFIIFSPKLEFIDEKQLAGRLWPLAKEYRELQQFIKSSRKLLRKMAIQKRLSKKTIKSISALSEKFFIIIKNTIRLPKNLLPADWPLPQAAQNFSQLLKLLRGKEKLIF